MTVHELIAELNEVPGDAEVLLHLAIWNVKMALDDTQGIPPGETAGCNRVIPYDTRHVYVVCADE